MALSKKGNIVFTEKENSVHKKKKPKVVVNQSGLVTRQLSDLIDVETTGKKQGSVLVYSDDDEKFKATNLLQDQTINGGNF